MKRKWLLITCLFCTALLSVFFHAPDNDKQEAVKRYYYSKFNVLNNALADLKTAVEHREAETVIHKRFAGARLAYKQLELFLEYYFELDAYKFNGIAIDFIEEEDPQASHEPQGFQVIEAMLYPHVDARRAAATLSTITKLQAVASGISANKNLFVPDEYIPDAAMEELYRIISLGITGFDSPVAKLSFTEAVASLSSVQFIIDTYLPEDSTLTIKGNLKINELIAKAQAYLKASTDFDRFNRMEFILRFMNPLCTWLAKAKQVAGYHENPGRYSLIQTSGSLFSEDNLNTGVYTGDDTMTAARIALGRKLFYEPSLSANGKRACAGCHKPYKGFTDGLRTAMQLDEHTALARNTPTLWNAALQKNLFYDSRQHSLDQLITEVLSNSTEMNSGTEQAIAKIIQQPEYNTLYRNAFPSRAATPAGDQIVKAIGMYLRTLISYRSRFDAFMRGNKTAMTASEVNGFNVFTGKAKCATCHYIPLFNGSKPPTYFYQESEVLGVPGSPDTAHASLDTDPGRIAILGFPFTHHAFKTPTLRNIALTAPYMHNGVYQTLEQVIDFYDRGGGQGLHLAVPNQSLPPEKLQLTKTEKEDLKAFLLTLTDTSGVH